MAAVLDLDLEPLCDDEVREQARVVQRELDRLTARRSECAGTLERRAIRREGTGRESRAVGSVRDFLEDELNLTPSEAKRVGRMGRQVAESPQVARAYRDGRVREPHARIIIETLRHLVGSQREEVERQLLEAAARCTPTQLRRHADRLLARADAEGAEREATRRHRRRYVRATQTEDGMLALHAAFSGLDAEVVQTAINAFRQPDAAEERRAPEQASADAMVAALRAALDAGAAPTQRGVPPHVLVVVRDDDGSGAGPPPPGEGAWTGPLSEGDLRRLCRDAQVSRVVVNARGVPVEASSVTRNVHVGIWRALLVRDRGCRWPGCDIPPVWCDVAHGLAPYREEGRLGPDNALLLCRRHHRKVDDREHGWEPHIDGAQITFVSAHGRRVVSPPPEPPPGAASDLPAPTSPTVAAGNRDPGTSPGDVAPAQGSGDVPDRAPPVAVQEDLGDPASPGIDAEDADGRGPPGPAP